MAQSLAEDEDFQTAVTVAEIDGVSIMRVLDERDEFRSAARLARVLVVNKRQEEQSSS